MEDCGEKRNLSPPPQSVSFDEEKELLAGNEFKEIGELFHDPAGAVDRFGFN